MTADSGRTELRLACMCLQLTKHAVNMVAKQGQNEGGAMIARLATGQVLEQLGCHASTIAKLIPRDPLLPMDEALPRLLVTLSHLIIRLQTFQSFPALLCQLSKFHDPTGYLSHVMEFVDLPEPDQTLDAGCSNHLWKEAWKADGSAAGASQYLLSPACQTLLKEVTDGLQPTSLDVERKHAVDKKAEHSKVLTIARASRNSILRQYRKDRQAWYGKWRKTNAEYQKLRFVNRAALALKENPNLAVFKGGRKPKIDRDLLKAYLALHGTRLDDAAKEARQRAQDIARNTGIMNDYFNFCPAF
eukprot:4809755-Amphidinium_carterae.2